MGALVTARKTRKARRASEQQLFRLRRESVRGLIRFLMTHDLRLLGRCLPPLLLLLCPQGTVT